MNGNFWDSLANFNDVINEFVWVKIGIILLIGTGILMTILTGFFQITHFGHWWKKTIGSLFDKKVISHTKEKASISQFQALCTALAATVGVGNIAGVICAILLMQLLSSAFTILRFSPYAKKLIWGSILIIVMGLNYLSDVRARRASMRAALKA